MVKEINKEDLEKIEKMRVVFSLNKKDFIFFRKYLNDNKLEFSFLVNDLMSKTIPDLKKGVKSFRFKLNLGETSKD